MNIKITARAETGPGGVMAKHTSSSSLGLGTKLIAQEIAALGGIGKNANVI